MHNHSMHNKSWHTVRRSPPLFPAARIPRPSYHSVVWKASLSAPQAQRVEAHRGFALRLRPTAHPHQAAFLFWCGQEWHLRILKVCRHPDSPTRFRNRLIHSICKYEEREGWITAGLAVCFSWYIYPFWFWGKRSGGVFQLRRTPPLQNCPIGYWIY